MALSNDIVKFANGDTTFYEAACDNYFNPTAEKSELLQKLFFAEMERQSGVVREGLNTEAWMSHPSNKWAFMSIVDATINAIIPQVVSPAFRLFMDLRFVEYGDVLKFRVQPNTFYTVSKGGHGERTTFRQKQFASDVTIAPIEHIITVYADMYRVMAGKENIAEFLRLVVTSVEQSMYKDALAALSAGLSAIPAGAYHVTGAFAMKNLIKMAETVQAYNGGVKPVIVGSKIALMNVIPDSTLGYRMNADANGGAIQLIKNVMGFDVMALDNAAAGGDALVLAEDEIYVISPAQDKLIKGVINNALTNGNQFYDNADLTENYTMRKGWDFAYASAAKAGIYKITE